MAILVTGGAGFIGSHFIEQLLRWTSEPIVCLDNFNDYYDPALKRANVSNFQQHPQVTVIEADFCHPEGMAAVFQQNPIRRVCHLGAYAGVRASVEYPLTYARNNVEGTLCLLECARTWPVEAFVLASSSTVYGKHAEIPFREDRPLGTPASPYGATKRAAELLGLNYYALHGVPVTCVRPFSVYGPRLRPDLALSVFTDSILRGRPLPLYGNGSVLRDFTHVHDICRGLWAALNQPAAAGQCINLGHSEPLAIRDVIQAIEDAAGQRAKIDRRPARDEDLPVTCADLQRAKELLGYVPQVAFQEGVMEFVAWYRAWHAI